MMSATRMSCSGWIACGAGAAAVLVLSAVVQAQQRGASGSGATCGDPISITLPAALPFDGVGTTCGMVDDFNDPCIGPHGDGEDTVYEITVTETIQCVHFELTASGGFMSMTLDDSCPGDGDCIAVTADFGGVPQITMDAALPAGTYYLVIDSWSKFASCISDYSLSITECVPPVWACCLDGVCLGDMTEVDCATAGGNWYQGASCAEDNVCPPVCEADAMDGQSVVPAPFAFTAGTSDANAAFPFLRYESYSVNADICGLTWWGVPFDEPPCFEQNMEFEVTFYEDDGGMPGAVVCTYALTPEEIVFTNPYTHNYAGNFLRQWNAELPECCTLYDGWISIQGTSVGAPDCLFGWLESNVGDDGSSLFFDGFTTVPQSFDLSFCLYGGPANCVGDIAQGDNAVNVFDLFELLSNWGTDGAGAGLASPSDVVDVFDLFELLAHWGPC